MDTYLREDKIRNAFQNLINILHEKDTGRISIFDPYSSNSSQTEQALTLSDVEEKLFMGEYNDNHWRFIEHVSESFQSIQKKFSSRSSIYQISIQCEDIFNHNIEKIMKNEGYCCGNYYVNRIKPLECSGNKKCSIKSNCGYYRFESWTYCENCFKKLSEENVYSSSNSKASKGDFNYSIHIEAEREEFVKCIKCKRFQHERCVLYLKSSGIPFFCKSCCANLSQVHKMNVTAKLIPKTECDIFIEKYLVENKIDNAERIIIRMMSNVPSKFKSLKIISKYRPELNDFEDIKYNNCAIFSFVKLADESEICFFGVYFQLYSNKDCPSSNKNTVYLSYIDSVNLNLINHKTKLYQHIILGLFEYLKSIKYQRVFIWSCPPKRDVDYIFNEKPSDMRIPSSSKLNEWYNNLMKTAVEKKIIKDFKGIAEYTENSNDLPYFDSDIWPIKLEEAIIEAEWKLRKSKARQDEIEKCVKNLMRIQIADYNDQYFVLTLNITIENRKSGIPGVVRGCWMDRSRLMDMFQEWNLKYSNERLARFSTFLMLYRFFCEDAICSKCGKISENGVNVQLLCPKCHKRLVEIGQTSAPQAGSATL